MLNSEQTQILEQAIFLLFRLRNEQSIERWEVNAAREFEKQVGLNKHESAFAKILKELKRMPQKFKEVSTVNGLKNTFGERPTGFMKYAAL